MSQTAVIFQTMMSVKLNLSLKYQRYQVAKIKRLGFYQESFELKYKYSGF